MASAAPAGGGEQAGSAPTPRLLRRVARSDRQDQKQQAADEAVRDHPPSPPSPVPSSRPVAVGIDLGTTYSCVAALVNGTLEVIANRDFGERTTPSCVAFADGEERELVGEAALGHAATDPANAVVEAKRLIGRHFREESLRADLARWPFRVTEGAGGQPVIHLQHDGQPLAFSPQEISSKVLLKLKADAEAYLGRAVTEAVITVPAYFTDSQRRATKEAGELAGLKVLQLLPEPTAAAVAYGVDRRSEKPRRVLVYDLGGGTFDVSVVLVTGSHFDVKAVGGSSHLGGTDFDHLVVQHVAEEIERRSGKEIRSNAKKMRRLLTLCERAKRDLSACMKADIDVESIVFDDLSIGLQRAKFEELSRELLNSTAETVKSALACAALTTADIDEVILVGGSTRMPCVQRLLSGLFPGKPILKTINPDEAVALGAALWAAAKAGDDSAFVKDLRVQNVLPLSIGVRVGEGVMRVVIPRNSVLPANKVLNLETAYKNQPGIQFRIFQGERCIAVRNKFIGEVNLDDLPPSPPGLPCDFALAVDEDGILAVKVKLAERTDWKRCTMHLKDQGPQEIISNLEDAERYREEDKRELGRLKALFNLNKFLLNEESEIPVENIPSFREAQTWLNQNADARTEEFESRFEKVKRLKRQ